MRARAFVPVAFAIGAVAGTALDALHTHSGTTAYASPVLARAAWWTPLLFGSAGVAVLGAYPALERLTGRAVAPRPSGARIAPALGLFAGLYAASGFLPASNAVKLAVLAAGALLLFAAVARSARAALLAAVAALVGPLVEVTLIASGAFVHLQPDLLGIPMWLPALYAAASLAFGPAGVALAGRAR